ncbi:unnamed protein product [Caenorhabditis brenneri]
MEEFCQSVTMFIVMNSHETGLAMQTHVTRVVENLCIEYLNNPTHANFNITICKIHEELTTAFERINQVCTISLDAIATTMLHSVSDVILEQYNKDYDFGANYLNLERKLMGDSIIVDPRIPAIRRLIASMGANVCCTAHGATYKYFQQMFELAMANKAQSTAQMLNESLAHVAGNLGELQETFKTHLAALGRQFNE